MPVPSGSGNQSNSQLEQQTQTPVPPQAVLGPASLPAALTAVSTEDNNQSGAQATPVQVVGSALTTGQPLSLPLTGGNSGEQAQQDSGN